MTVCERTDIVILGAGLSGMSLVLALVHSGYKGQIRILEKASHFNANKTWCFWGRESIPTYLRPLIVREWNRWSVSTTDLQEHVEHQSTSTWQYCCLRGSDFYQLVESTLKKHSNIKVEFSTDAEPCESAYGKVQVKTAGKLIVAEHGFDSRSSTNRVSKEGLYQSFVGAWVETKSDQFDAGCVQLMADMQAQEDGIQFVYTLPFKSNHALVELTRFTKTTQPLPLMHQALTRYLNSRFGDDFQALKWEEGVLPMEAGNSEQHTDAKSSWISCGIRAGHIRPATGYAFLAIQRWSMQQALYFKQHKRFCSLHPIPSRFQSLDKVFLRVLGRYSDKSPDIFVRMVKHTNAEEFARFMIETATCKDICKVIYAMPKWPFLKSLVG